MLFFEKVGIKVDFVCVIIISFIVGINVFYVGEYGIIMYFILKVVVNVSIWV